MEPPPPPPPPHGDNASGGKRGGGLPDGKYDIFVIPPSSAGSGFLYLPSLQVNRNSFIAGAVCMFLVGVIWNTTVPVVKSWFHDTMAGGGSGVMFLLMAVGVVAWALGKTQAESTHPDSSSKGGPGAAPNFNSQPAGGAAPPPNAAPPPPKSSWQRPQPQANPGAKSGWEKAREETRKKEEDRKKAEDAKKRAEELEKRKAELEKERQRIREKDLRERLERERKERQEKEAKDANAAKAARAAAAPTPKASPPKRPPMPSARTEDDDAYSFRPYDRPKHKANSAASMYSESSYAPSQSTARTTPPPSFSGPYTTKDPDKIMIKGVFRFNNAFMRTPISQLISGQRPVTDGLILRITTEGLFIDDDRRSEPQREWDVKAWTMKLVEVWCSNFLCSTSPQHSTSLDHRHSAQTLADFTAELRNGRHTSPPRYDSRPRRQEVCLCHSAKRRLEGRCRSAKAAKGLNSAVFGSCRYASERSEGAARELGLHL
ncbi:uncharacterized protein HMPREF1541_09487, partial [Cyphellophora europaea CBS 101466]